jgi:methyl-accepting chemotaxis protein
VTSEETAGGPETAHGTDGSQDITAVAATAARPDDPGELRREIERTREQLGDTVEALVAKTDVKARAQAKASRLAGRLRSRAAEQKDQAGRVAERISAVTPDPVQRAAMAAAATRQRRLTLAAAIGAVSVAWLVIARRGRQ